METLRKPFFIAAAVLILLVVLVETGSGLFVRGKVGALATEAGKIKGVQGHLDELNPATLNKLQERKPPGVGIPFMGLLDGLIVFAVGLMGAQFLIGERLQGRLQGIVSLIVSLVVLLAAIGLFLLTLGKLLLMVGLFVAVPFGTLTYLAIWGFFDVGAAKVALGLLLALKLAFAVCLVLAHQRFLQNKGLVIIVILSLVTNLIVSFLHACVPTILVSITDSIAGLIGLVIAAIWAVVLLVGSVISVVKAVT